MDANLEKMLFERLRNYIYKEKKSVCLSEIVDEFQLKTAVVNNVLEKFVNVEKAQGAPISVSYVLSGVKNDGEDDIKLLRFVIVDDDELEERKKFFTELNGIQIRSITPKSEQSESSDSFSRKSSVPQNLKALQHDQKLSGITNKLIKLRLNRLNKLMENSCNPDVKNLSPKKTECKDDEDSHFTKLSNLNKKVKLELKSEEHDCDKINLVNKKKKKDPLESETKVKETSPIKENGNKKDLNDKDFGNKKKKIKIESDEEDAVKTSEDEDDIDAEAMEILSGGMSDSTTKSRNKDTRKEEDTIESESMKILGNEKSESKLKTKTTNKRKQEEEKADAKPLKTLSNGKSESKSKVPNSNKGKKQSKSNQKVRLITDMFARKEKPMVN